MDGFVFFCDGIITYLRDWAFCPKNFVNHKTNYFGENLKHVIMTITEAFFREGNLKYVITAIK